MKVLQIMVSGAVLVLLAGCSALGANGKSIDYGSAASKVPTLEVPPDLSAPGIDETYRIPPGEGGAVATYSDYSKGGAVQSGASSAVLPDMPGVRLEQNGTQRWLVVNDKPENVWAVVKAFWQENGLSIKSEDPAAGIMETDWTENRAKLPDNRGSGNGEDIADYKVYSVGERDQYTTRLQRTKDGAATEVYISQRGMEEVYSRDKKVPQWQARGNDPELEAIMLQRMMVRFGSSAARAKDSLATTAAAPATVAVQATSPAADIAADPAGSSSLRVVSGITVIAVNDPFDRAWRKVGLAIESARLEVEDKDREKGIYYLGPIKLETGWLDKLKFWKSDVDTTSHYRVIVKDGGTSCVVSITDQNGASNKASKEMLEAIFKNINKQ